jgi:hypothetical protein
MVRYRLTPYGTEWGLTNELAVGRRSMQIEVRAGRAPGAKPWGAGVRARELTAWRAWRLDAGADVWRQPNLFDADEADPTRLRIGAQLRLRAERPVAKGITSIIELGAKSAGFMPGEPLGASVILRAGVGLPFARR